MLVDIMEYNQKEKHLIQQLVMVEEVLQIVLLVLINLEKEVTLVPEMIIIMIPQVVEVEQAQGLLLQEARRLLMEEHLLHQEEPEQ